ncbi:uncharacterized protein LOC130734501 [Lotus japonicus]|uniref:uncharacterized protein LOC130734501 n=1 Tax=Lotus japonicus TaxID=34305 RepID=UPI002590EE98|nr:uncharacterized protein LOC130734501 [Lotus japonicus]
MAAQTNSQSYWLNWRFLLCSICLLVITIFSLVLIWKYERIRRRARNGSRENQEETSATLYEDETWKPSLKGIHPAWLMAFRVFAFILLLVLLIVDAAVYGGHVFFFYTQWTCLLLIIYFGLGSLLSMHGCYQHHKKANGDKVDNVDGDAEQGISSAPALPLSSIASDQEKNLEAPEKKHVRQHAGTWGYIFQIIFQINAGAVMLTDCVFWFVIVPFLTNRDYNLSFLTVCMHSLNAVFLIGDTALNCLRFPWFRIGYFCLWTATYLIFQWIVHACINLWWPYPFLDLSSSYAPLWYFAVALLHIPCYGIFALVMKLKHYVFTTWCPDSYQCLR